MPSLELDGRQAVIVPMTTFWVVEHLDVIEHIPSCFFAVSIDTTLDPLALQ
jgi:hypothetical protein